MSRKRLIILGVIIIVLIPILFALFSLTTKRKPSPVTVNVSQPLAQNIPYPDKVTAGKLRYFTGTAVAELDVNSLATTSLSQEFGLPEVIEARWSKNHVLIKTAKPTAVDEVYRAEYDNLLKKSDAAWWTLNIPKSELRLVNTSSEQNLYDAVWQNESSLYLLLHDEAAGGMRIVKQPVGGTQDSTQLKATDDMFLVGQTAKGLVVKRGADVVLLDESGGEKKLPFTTQQRPILGLDGTLIIEKPYEGEDENDAPGGNFAMYDVTNSKVIADDIDNTGNSTGDDGVVLALPYNAEGSPVSQADAQSFVFSRDGKKTTPLVITEDQVLQAGKLKKLVSATIQEGRVQMLITNTTDELVEISTESTVKDKKSPYPLIPFSTSRPQLADVGATYHAVSNLLTLYLDPTTNDTPRQKQAVMDAVRQQGKDPNQIRKRWEVIQPHRDDPQEEAIEQSVEDNFGGDGVPPELQ